MIKILIIPIFVFEIIKTWYFTILLDKRLMTIIKIINQNKKMTEYISEKGAEALRRFQYKGGSIAYSYKYLWSPIAQKVVEFVPRTVAPNLITVIGTIIHIIGNLSMALQEHGKPNWPPSLLFFGICVFVYYTLDNVDGKQARRTKTSSPLGMCMDHGCDVLGVSFIALGVARVILLDDHPVALLFTSQMAVLGSFWLSVWAQYHSQGILVLGKFNAVDDGIPFVSFLGIATYFLGQQWWEDTHIGPLTAQYFLVAFIWIAGILQTLSFVFFSGDNFTKDIKGALSHFIHLPFLALSLASVVYLTDWHLTHFFAVYFTTALIVVRDTTYMHVCVCAEDKYNQWQLPTVIYIIGYPILTTIVYFTQPSQTVQCVMIYGMLAISVYNYFSYTTKVSRQMANILGIRIFHIKPSLENQKSH